MTVCGRSGRDPRHVALSSLQTTVHRLAGMQRSAGGRKHPWYLREGFLEMFRFDDSGILNGGFLEGALGQMIEDTRQTAGQLYQHILGLGVKDGVVNADLF